MRSIVKWVLFNSVMIAKDFIDRFFNKKSESVSSGSSLSDAVPVSSEGKEISAEVPETTISDSAPVKGSIRKNSSIPVVRSRKDGDIAGQRVYIPNGLYLVLNMEKSQRLLESGEFMSFGEFVAEAVSFYLKKTRKEAYEEYKRKGWIK